MMKPVPKLGFLSPLPIKRVLSGKRKSPRCWCVGSDADSRLRSDQQFPPARASSGHCGRQSGIFTCQCIRERHQIAGCLSLTWCLYLKPLGLTNQGFGDKNTIPSSTYNVSANSVSHFSLCATEIIISTSYIWLFSRGSNKA